MTVVAGDIVEGLGSDDYEALQIFVPTSPDEAAAEIARQSRSGSDFSKVYDGLTEEMLESWRTEGRQFRQFAEQGPY